MHRRLHCGALALMLLLVLPTAGCGHRGALFLPPTQEQEPPAGGGQSQEQETDAGHFFAH